MDRDAAGWIFIQQIEQGFTPMQPAGAGALNGRKGIALSQAHAGLYIKDKEPAKIGSGLLDKTAQGRLGHILNEPVDRFNRGSRRAEGLEQGLGLVLQQ